jgi:AcrR family transcriptional regulator
VALTSSRIVQAAVDLADEDGLGAVSMSRVARRLGSAPMSLYRHVSDKDELLLLMHDTAWRSPEPPEPDGAWRADLVTWCVAQRQVLRAHPWLEEIRLSERAGTPSQLGWIEWGLRVLGPTALTEQDKVETLLLLSGFVLWEARLHAEAISAARTAAPSVPEATREFGALVRTVVDPGRFPALLRAADAGGFDRAPGTEDAAFAFGLQRLLDGVERLVGERADGAAPVGPTDSADPGDPA